MAASRHIKVRLPAYELAALEFISSRHGEHEATWAAHALRAAIAAWIEDQGARGEVNAFYAAQQAELAQAELDRHIERLPAAPRARSGRVPA